MMGRTHSRAQRSHASERGQALILFVFGLAALMGFVGLAIDVGLAFVARREMVNAADSAALAGAARLVEGAPVSAAIAEAEKFAENNGYSDGADVSVAVNIPPTSGLNSGDSNFVEVVIEQEIGTFFAVALGRDTWEVTARAVAGVETQANAEYALISLNPTASNALDLNGNATVTVNGAGVMVNSNHDHAIDLNGNAALTADVIRVFGGWRTNGNATIDPIPTNAAPIPDPLAALPVPAVADYTVQSASELRVDANQSVEVDPGIFIDGIQVSGNGQLIMNSGIYFLRGGGLQVSGNGSVSGNAVLIYVTCGSGSCPSGTSGDVDISGNGIVSLSPMTSGDWAGVTFFQDRNNNQNFRISGNGLAGTSGAIYARDARVEFNGNASTTVQIIADTVRNNGNADISIVWDGGVTVESGGMKLVE